MPERLTFQQGGACTELAPQVVDKYFSANSRTQPFEARTAKAICSNCPIQEECLEAAIKGPRVRRGIIGGMSASAINRIKAWEAYEAGLRDMPKEPKPEIFRADWSPAKETAEIVRAEQALSFEERVHGVFVEIRQGKFETLNQAIAKIALIHAEASV